MSWWVAYEAMVQLARQEGLHEGLVRDVWRCPVCEMDVKIEHMHNHVQSNQHVKRKQWQHCQEAAATQDATLPAGW